MKKKGEKNRSHLPVAQEASVGAEEHTAFQTPEAITKTLRLYGVYIVNTKYVLK